MNEDNKNYTIRKNTNLMTANSAVGKYYIFGAKSTQWDNDLSPPIADNSIKTLEYDIPNEMLFGNRLTDSNLKLMVSRHDWVSGTVYDPYDDMDPNLFSKAFYVVTMESGSYHVFKCLDNNGGKPSTAKPLLSETSADDQYYSTSDNYQWKYMYSFNTSTYNSFATTDFIPLVPNTAVTGNSVYGAIETYDIVSAGGNYNSFTNGYFIDTNVGGNSQVLTIQGSDRTILKVSGNSFARNSKVTQIYNGGMANGTVFSQVGNILQLRNVKGVFSIGANVIVDQTSGSTADVIDESSPDVSSNDNFYTGCSIYISSGTGSGQISTISEYNVIGNARRILISPEFTISPDLTSKYIISPKVNIVGDGSGAIAISEINSTTKQLSKIRVVNTGSNYTFANVSIIGNTGSISVRANNAIVRAIMPPIGGHGSDVASELNAVYYGYSTVFNDTNGNLPDPGSSYRRIGIITDPLFANVGITYDYTTTPSFPTSNATVIGQTSNAQGYIKSVSGGTNTVYLSNVSGIFETNELIFAKYSNGSYAVDATENVRVSSVTGQGNVFDSRTLLICQSDTESGGSLSVNDKIVQNINGIDTGYAYIQQINTQGSNTLIYISEIKGLFEPSDLPTNSYKYIYDDATRQKSIRVEEIISSDIVPYSGNILYYENTLPITRNVSQIEKVKIILGFN